MEIVEQQMKTIRNVERCFVYEIERSKIVCSQDCGELEDTWDFESYFRSRDYAIERGFHFGQL